MPDFIRDFAEIIRNGEGSQLKRERLLKKLRRFEFELKRVGGDVNRFPQGKFVEALASDGHGNFKELMFQMVIARLYRGDFSDWTGWEYRNEWAQGSYAKEVPNRRWRLEPVNSIALLGEQGVGDEIMFGSCIPDVQIRVPEVVFECDPRLVEPFKRSLRIACKPRQDILERGEPVVQYLTMKRQEDAFIPVGDLPRLFRKSAQSFPGKAFLKPLPEYVDKWSHLKGSTGIAWRSRTGQFKPADLRIENPVCLQYDAWPYETEGMIVPDCDLRNDVEDLMGICANLEKVVSVGQTIVHIAGSIGARVEVVMPPVGSSRVKNQMPYRYRPGKMLWYPNVGVHDSLSSYLRSRPKS